MNKIPAGYKKTEVGTIPEDWVIKSLGDVLKIKHGKSQKDVSDKNGSYPILASGGVIGMANKFIYNKPSVLIGRKGTIDAPQYMETPFWSVDTLFYSEIFDGNYPRFLFYKFLLVDWYAHNEASGVPSLNAKTIEQISVSMPPTRAEQTAIATALNDADALITQLEKLIAKKRLIKQGAMQQLLKPQPGWQTKKLGEIADVVGGGTPSTFKSSYWNGNINWFTPTEIGDKKYSYQSIRKITQEGFANSSAKLLSPGTILLTSRASIGDVSILMTEGCTNQGFQSLVAKESVDTEFLYYVALTLKPILQQNASGSTFLEISPKKLKAINIKIPDKSQQISISQALSDIDKEIDALEAKLAKYKQIKQGMMQSLLTGKVRLL